jgi:hypothetical protein
MRQISNHIRRWLAAMALVVALLALGATPAFGWANGPNYGNGFGTHDWVLYEANRLAAAHGYSWVIWSVAQPMTDNPDTVLHDTWYHVYDIWGSSHWGDSPKKVAELYAQAVTQLKAGHRTAASRTVGLLSHYFSDTCNPLHTDGSTAEDRMHSDYEDAVDTRTTYKSENRGWIGFNGIQHRSSARSVTVAAATFAHGYYSTLVSDYNQSGYCSAVATITRRSLSRAVNDLADVIASIKIDSR